MSRTLGTIRRAQGTDLEQLTALWIALTEHHAAADALFALRRGAAGQIRRLVDAQLRDPETACFVHDDGESLSGMCIVRVDRAPPIHAEVCRGEITDLFVGDVERRRGIGRALAEVGLAWARERGAQRIEVRVAAVNPEGQAFWRSLGFGDFMDVLQRRL